MGEILFSPNAMNIELIKLQIEKLSQLLSSWSEGEQPSSIERDIALDSLKKIYDQIRFADLGEAEAFASIPVVAESPSSNEIAEQEAEQEAEEKDVEVELIFADDEFTDFGFMEQLLAPMPTVEEEETEREIAEEEEVAAEEEVAPEPILIPEPELEQDIEPAAEPEEEFELEIEPIADPEPEAESDVEPIIIPDTDAEELEIEVVLTPEPIAEPIPEVKVEPTPKVEVERTPEPATEPMPEVEIEVEQKSEPEQTPEPKASKKSSFNSLFGADEEFAIRRPRSKHQRMMSIYNDSEPRPEKVVDISKIFDLDEIDEPQPTVAPTPKPEPKPEPKPSRESAYKAQTANAETATTLAEVIATAAATLADTLTAPSAFADEINNSKIRSLREGIGLNDKFLMIRDLFDGDNEAYDEAITALDECDSLDDCMIHIIENYAWNPDTEGSKFIMQLLDRKHS